MTLSRKNTIKPLIFRIILSLTFAFGANSASLAQSPSEQFFQVGEVLINVKDDSNDVPIFTEVTFDFDTELPITSPPLVFVNPKYTATDPPCNIRIKNVTTTGFEAYCVEPPERNNAITGISAPMTMQYFAISPGVHDIPYSNNQTHRIIAGSFSTDATIGSRFCNNCTQDDSVTNTAAVSVTYPIPFTERPSLLTQIQTMNNESNRPPAVLVNGNIEERSSQPFLASNQFNQSENGFDYNMDRLSVSQGSVKVPETVAYLAVEQTINTIGRSECRNLDFSALGGPDDVPFQAYPSIVGGSFGTSSIVATRCAASQRIRFPNNCFNPMNTVISLADPTTRTNNEGRWILKCDNSQLQQHTSMTVSIDKDQSVSPSRIGSREAFDIVAFGLAFTNPVTLNYFRSQLVAKKQTTANGIALNKGDLVVRWQSLSEEENIGYNLWAKARGKWRIINRELINTNTQGTFSASQVYSHVIPAHEVRRLRIDKNTPLGLTSISTTAKEEFFGPYTVGKNFGSLMDAKPIDWTQIRNEYNQSMDRRGYVYIDGRYQPKRRLANNDSDGVIVTFDEAGMARVDYQSLKDAGLDLNDVMVNQIAVTHQGKTVRRHINGVQNNRFTSNSSIDFFALPVDGEASMYEKDNRYRISINRDMARPMRERTILNRKRGWSTDTLTQVKANLEENKAYVINSEKPNDPFMMAQIYALKDRSNQLSYSMNVPELNASHDVNMTLRINNLIDNVESHWKVSVNNEVVYDNKAPSAPYEALEFAVPAEHFVVGTNAIKIELINDTNAPILFSAIDSISVSQDDALVVTQSNGLHWVSDEDKVRFFEVAVDNARDINAYYAINQRNIPFKIRLTHRGNSPRDKVFIRNFGKGTQYFVGNAASMITPSHIEAFEAIDDNALFSQADYLIIANPIFAQSAAMDKFVTHKSLMGHRVHVASTSDIFQKFSDGMELPSAIKQYIQFFNNQSALKNVLLVGGDTYDYHNYVSKSISFVPSFYTHDETGNQFVPSDVMYADLDNNGIEDFAIGRWPLRQESELAVMVDKSVDYELAVRNGALNDSLFISDVNDTQNINYKASTEGLVSYQSNALNKSFVHAQDYVDAGESQSQIRQRIIDAASTKVASTIYNGHSSPSRWSFNNLLDVNNVGNLDDNGSLGMVMPLACYTSYTQSPTGNSLGYKLMAEKGAAVTLHGPAMVSSYTKNNLFGQGIQINLRDGMSVGEAIRTMKKSHSARSLKYHWILLGDPSLKMMP